MITYRRMHDSNAGTDVDARHARWFISIHGTPVGLDIHVGARSLCSRAAFCGGFEEEVGRAREAGEKLLGYV